MIGGCEECFLKDLAEEEEDEEPEEEEPEEEEEEGVEEESEEMVELVAGKECSRGIEVAG